MKLSTEERTCKLCGKKFRTKCHNDGTPYRADSCFCSKKCRANDHAHRKRGYVESVNCSWCGKKIDRTDRYRIDKKYPFLYCSVDCRRRGYYDMLKKTGKILDVRAKARERELGRPLGDICEICGTPFSEVAVFENTSCRRTPVHIDHIVPKSLGGSDNPSNLRPVCWFCNTVRGNSPIPDKVVREVSRLFWKLLAD